jgi:hypothetical protein
MDAQTGGVPGDRAIGPLPAYPFTPPAARLLTR